MSHIENDIEKRKINFARIDQALTVTKAIPRLHDLFTQAGIQEVVYVISDAYEFATGFPVPVSTRTILALSTEEEGMEKTQLDKPNAGLLLSEIHGLGTRTLYMQMGLAEKDLQKFCLRTATASREQIDPTTIRPPYWWKYPYAVIDLTTSHNMEPDKRFFGQGQEAQQHAISDGAVPLEAFIWSGAGSRETIDFILEQQDTKRGNKLGRIIRDPEKEEQQKLDEGFANLAKLIRQLR
jgi:hypothetical protein